MAIWIAACACLLTCLILLQLGELLTRRRRRLRERLRMAASQGAPGGAPGAPGAPGSNPLMAVRRRRLTLPVIPGLGAVFGRRHLERIRANLAKAGIPLKPEELAGIAAVAGLLGAGTGMLSPGRMLAAIALGIAGLLLPGLWVNQAKRRRAARLEAQLVDSLTLIANSMRAGHSFMQALEVASRDMAAPLAPELARTLKETRLGLSLDEAFASLVKRFDSRDLDLVVTGVLIQRQVGGNLAQVLDNIASTVEKRIKSRAKVRALTAQGRMSAWVISALPFGLSALIFTLYPDFGRVMLVNPLGIAMLAGAAALLVAGIFVIRKMVSIDV